MKTIKKRKINIDPMAEAKKGKYFEQYSLEAKNRIRLGVEIYNMRESLGISQQELAKQAQTTQKVISRIQNGDVNIGLALLNRIAKVLGFTYINWSRILNFSVPVATVIDTSKIKSGNSGNKNKEKTAQSVKIFN